MLGCLPGRASGSRRTTADHRLNAIPTPSSQTAVSPSQARPSWPHSVVRHAWRHHYSAWSLEQNDWFRPIEWAQPWHVAPCRSKPTLKAAQAADSTEHAGRLSPLVRILISHRSSSHCKHFASYIEYGTNAAATARFSSNVNSYRNLRIREFV